MGTWREEREFVQGAGGKRGLQSSKYDQNVLYTYVKYM